MIKPPKKIERADYFSQPVEEPLKSPLFTSSSFEDELEMEGEIYPPPVEEKSVPEGINSNLAESN